MSFLEKKALSIAFNSSPFCRLYETVSVSVSFFCVHLIFFILKIWYFFTDNEEEIKQLREEVGELRRELKDLRGKLQTDFNSITIIRIRDSSSFPSPVQASPAKINITLVYIKLDSITYRCFR